MKNKKSYMNVKNIISEGVLDRLISWIGSRKLKTNKSLLSMLKDLNGDYKKLEKMMNDELKDINPKAKPIKFKKLKLTDLMGKR